MVGRNGIHSKIRKPLFLQKEEIVWDVPTTTVASPVLGGRGQSYETMAELMAPDTEDTDEGEKVPSSRPLKWATNGKIYWLTTETVDRIDAGLYTTGVSDQTGPFLAQMLTHTDQLLELPDAKSSQVVSDIKHFWTLKAAFTKFGMLHKRGILLYGPAGSGKTSVLQQLIKILIKEHDGVAVYIDHPLVAASCLQSLRKVEPKRPVIALLEDIDILVTRHGLAGYLALLDGEAQVDNVCFIGTTNHIREIDDRLANRPSRFDRRVLIDMPSAIARGAYIKHRIVTLAKEELSAEELDRWVRLTEDFSIAHLRELIVSVKCLEKPLEEVVAILRDMNETPPEEIASNRNFGFKGETK